jgi:hypothetical protein
MKGRWRLHERLKQSLSKLSAGLAKTYQNLRSLRSFTNFILFWMC